VSGFHGNSIIPVTFITLVLVSMLLFGAWQPISAIYDSVTPPVLLVLDLCVSSDRYDSPGLCFPHHEPWVHWNCSSFNLKSVAMMHCCHPAYNCNSGIVNGAISDHNRCDLNTLLSLTTFLQWTILHFSCPFLILSSFRTIGIYSMRIIFSTLVQPSTTRLAPPWIF